MESAFGRCTRTLGLVVLMASFGGDVQTHDEDEDEEVGAAPALCRETQCVLALEWRDGVPTRIDRRYGNPYQFESLLLTNLAKMGYAFTITRPLPSVASRQRPSSEESLAAWKTLHEFEHSPEMVLRG